MNAINDIAVSSRVASMQPVVFDGCLAWLHLTDAAAVASTAVLLCPGLRTDGLTGHRSYRQLADALARAGFPAMRFDYPGTADSCDPSPEAELWGVWRGSIHAAAECLHDHTGTSRLVLAGLRFGATLAASVAAERDDVAGLVLLAPVLRGRSYIRQLQIEAGMQSGTPPAPGSRLVLHEMDLSAETVQRIGQADLSKLVLSASCQVAIYAQAESPLLDHCVGQWRAQGAGVTCHDFTGLEPMLRPGFMAHEPPADVARVADWIAGAVANEKRPQAAVATLPKPQLRPGQCVEVPLRFGVDGALFGVLCRPIGPATSDLAVIIGNSSGDPRYGFARVAVDLARQLADEGITSLRMDFAGLGDSLAACDTETHIFETDRSPDISHAIDTLESLGYRRFAVQGLCSGAYHGLHAALADQRISLLLLVNFPLFQWRPGDAVEFMSHAMQSPAHFLRGLGNPATWRRLFGGNLQLRGRVVAQAQWFGKKIAALTDRIAQRLGVGQVPNFARDTMRQLAPRVRTLFLFAEGDAGIAALAEAFGPRRAPPGATLQIVPGLDHSLSGPGMRRIAARHILTFLHAVEAHRPHAIPVMAHVAATAPSGRPASRRPLA